MSLAVLDPPGTRPPSDTVCTPAAGGEGGGLGAASAARAARPTPASVTVSAVVASAVVVVSAARRAASMASPSMSLDVQHATDRSLVSLARPEPDRTTAEELPRRRI